MLKVLICATLLLLGSCRPSDAPKLLIIKEKP